MKKFVEIRSYNLKPGTREEFHRLVLKKSMPMLKRWKVDVVTFGPSRHDSDSYYLIRAYDSLEHRRASQDTFYGSADLREGPREEMVALIESYIDIVLEMDETTVNALRKNHKAIPLYLQRYFQRAMQRKEASFKPRWKKL